MNPNIFGWIFGLLLSASCCSLLPVRSACGLVDGATTPQDEARLQDALKKRAAMLPKVESTLHRMAVYRDGIIVEATVYNRTPSPIRLSLVQEPLWLNGLKLVDAKGREWEIPRLRNQYLFEPTTHRNTVLLKPGEEVDLRLVDRPDDGTLRKAKQDGLGAPGRPSALRYDVSWLSTVDGDKLSGARVSVQRIAKGTVRIEWKDTEVPPGSHTTAGRQRREEGKSPSGKKVAEPEKKR